MHRFYVEFSLEIGGEYQLPARASHHLIHVLRCQVDDQITLFGTSGGDYRATITKIMKQSVCVTVDAYQACNTESPLSLHLIQSLSRSQKLDVVIQKAVELGVTRITLVMTDRSVMRVHDIEKRLDHWRGVMIHACQQCGRDTLPVLHYSAVLGSVLSALSDSVTKWVLQPGAITAWQHDVNAPVSDVVVAVGPEGGYSADEQVLFSGHGFQAVRLGPRVLRTETAAIAMMALLQHAYGDS